MTRAPRYRRQMATRPRRFAENAPTHLTSRAVDSLELFPTALACLEFLGLLKKISARVRWTIGAWCLMSTHYHLLVFTPDPATAPRAMQTLNSVYARWFNAEHARRGHVFGSRYTDTPCETDRHLSAALAYVWENPVRAGIVRDLTSYAWSGDALLEPRIGCELVAPPTRNRHNPVRRAG